MTDLIIGRNVALNSSSLDDDDKNHLLHHHHLHHSDVSAMMMHHEKVSAKNFSYFGLFTCLATIVLAFMFKDYFMYVLSYLDATANSNEAEFHAILLLLFVGVSLPMLWGYTICILICAYVYSFLVGFFLVCAYSTVGMSVSFYVCRYLFYDFANEHYLRAIVAIIESRDRGLRIVFLSRLMPIPFGLANSLFALTDIDFRKYILASIVGLVPTQLILCYIGSTLKSMSDVLSNDSTARTASFVFVVQLIVAVGAMYYILNAAKKELDKHISGENKSLPSSTSSAVSSSASSKSMNLIGCGLVDSASMEKFSDTLLQKCAFCNNNNSGEMRKFNSPNTCESCKLLSSGSSSSVIQMA